ncbi:hypothetical protein BT96DRAFT_1002838 [Gymnopus androsaceus JB14]|uniref:Uncharacterized protein n=1 Tax=Gymnopus androsaceus JB14 TaxID=1447944 RepID=A0A6A4GVK0_9AGAR|nr:hypothetical protein BT96DRAFT_1002838 [Gymnopus androsaceus JB14]
MVIALLLGMMSVTASLGFSLLWDTEIGPTHMDKYTYLSKEYFKAGCYLAIDISNASIHTETDATLALLAENVKNPSEVMATLLPYIVDKDIMMEISSLAALALGFVFMGSKNGEITGTILQMHYNEPNIRKAVPLAIGLVYVSIANPGHAIKLVAVRKIFGWLYWKV